MINNPAEFDATRYKKTTQLRWSTTWLESNEFPADCSDQDSEQRTELNQPFSRPECFQPLVDIRQQTPVSFDKQTVDLVMNKCQPLRGKNDE